MTLRGFVLVVCLGGVAAAMLWIRATRPGTALQAQTSQPAQAGAPAAHGDGRVLLGDTGAGTVAGKGAQPAEPATREAGPELRLIGVMASGHQGLALIAGADGLARVFRVGAVVHGNTVVKSVLPTEVRLGLRDGPASRVLVLPTASPGAAQVGRQARADLLLEVDASIDTSPIVPPHADMSAPRASESGTAGSRWNEIRGKPVTPQLPTTNPAEAPLP